MNIKWVNEEIWMVSVEIR